ncbi:hypothetical protein [Terriglobus albidus]|uniref:hypothetical protein n=1 Tax=Terriglobus albidus TaxID=1592106 RepID=UPI0021E01949|nr:hypothetical protein [Terriglobus albidus]
MRKLIAVMALCGATSFLYGQDQPPHARHVSPVSLNRNTGELFQESMHWNEYFYDPAVSLVKSPSGGATHGTQGEGRRYMVRESSWYALGLLFRDQPGDRERAAKILDAVLKQQYTDPNVPWYGTYKRTPAEPMPPSKSELWRDYDPNWRVFIGTTFAMILIEYPDRIPAELRQRMYKAIDLAIDGEMREGRLIPAYTNIALMYGFLWDFAAIHDHNAAWKKKSVAWNEAVYRLFEKYGTFPEYNSPTYSGVDIYGLALWRDYGSSAHMREMGGAMEASLWRELANYYQPDLRNLSGPFDRAYGMDMTHYVSVVGVWMRTVLDAATAPLPPISATTDHLADIWFASHIAILGTAIPSDALAKMQHFAGSHAIRQNISGERTATAWIGDRVLVGGELTSKTKDAGGPSSQFHPATVHWRTPAGEIGWVQLVACPLVDASADENGLDIDTKGAIRLRVHVAGLKKGQLKNQLKDQLKAEAWKLPGLQVGIVTDASGFSIDDGADSVDLVYSGLSHLRLNIKPVE